MLCNARKLSIGEYWKRVICVRDRERLERLDRCSHADSVWTTIIRVTPKYNSARVKRAPGWTLVATILASSMTFIDGTVVNVALPALQKNLGATITEVQWVIEAYALFLGALILVGGSVGDQFGRRRMFLAGVIVFTAASVLCGVAGSARVLVAARALQGIGAAFLVPGSLAIISATYDSADRGRAIGTWSAFSAITTAIGPVTGGRRES